MKDKTHKQLLKDDLENMHKGLKKHCEGMYDDDEIEKMKIQAGILDKIMLRMLEDADERYYDRLIQYGLALRAQNQYRQTVQTIDTLNLRAAKRLEKEQNKQFEKHVEAAKTRGIEYINPPESSGAIYTNYPQSKD